jgi:hypothetical protein
MHFLQNCLNPLAVLMLFIAASCLFGYAIPRSQESWLWVLWVFIALLALVAWVMLVAS